MARQWLTQLDEGDVAPYVLLPGDPGRVETVASLWDDAREIAYNREYRTYTGTYRGVPISCTSTGIGGPSTAIALEELARVGAHTFIRIGTCGTFLDSIPNGDIVIFDSAMRYDGTTDLYAPKEFPAVAHHEVLNAQIAAAADLGYATHVGVTRTTDTFYARHPHPGASFGDYWQSGWKEFFPDLRRMGVAAAEMEASVVLMLPKLWGLRAGGMAVVLDNIFEVSNEETEFDPNTQMLNDRETIIRMSRLGCEAIVRLKVLDDTKS